MKKPKKPQSEFISGSLAASALGVSYSHLCRLRSRLTAKYHFVRISSPGSLRHTYRYHLDRIIEFLGYA